MATDATVGLLRVVLSADTQAFAQGLDSAKVKLGVFDRESKNAARSLARMTEGFSGQRLAAEATKMAASLERVGGVTKLTDAELRRVRGTVDEVTAKFARMGEQVPPSIARLRSEIQKLDDGVEFDTLRDRMQGVGKASTDAGTGLGKMSGVMQGVVAGAVGGLTIKLLGLVGTIGSLASDSVSRANQLQSLGTSFERLSGGAEKAEQTLQALRRGSFGLVADLELMQASNKAMLLGLGLTSEEMGELARTATVLGRAMGQDATKSLDDLITALGRSSPLILDNLGLTVKLGEANEAYAESLGKTVSELTEAEKKQAFMRAAMESARAKVAELGDVQLTASEAATKLWTGLTNLSTAAADLVVNNRLVRNEIESVTEGMTQLELIIRHGPLDAWEEYKKTLMGTIPTLQATDDAHVRAAKSIQGVALSEDALFKALEGTNSELERANAAVKEAAERAKLVGTIGGAAAVEEGRKLAAALKEVGGAANVLPSEMANMAAAFDRAAVAAQNLGDVPLATQFKDLAASVRPALSAISNLTSALVPLRQGVTDVGEALHRLVSGSLQETAQETERARIATEEWAMANGAVLAPSIKQVTAASIIGAKETKTFGESLREALGDLPNVIQRAVEGGGNLFRSITTLLGRQMFEAGGVLAERLTAGLTRVLGPMLGETLGNLIPGLGTLLGSQLGGLIDRLVSNMNEMKGRILGTIVGGPIGWFVGGALGRQAEHRRVNDLRDAFVDAAGGIHELNVRAQQAGLTLDRFLRAKTVREYEAAVRELEEAFEQLDERREQASTLFDEIMEAGRNGIPAAFRPAIEQLIELGLLTDEQIEKLRGLNEATIDVEQLQADLELIGGRMESLGPQFRQANIDKTAAQYVNAIQRMIDAGGDVGGILFDAREELSELVQQSIRSGTTLPANMQPWIEELIRAGLLVDENGEKITDISKIKFGEPIKTEAEIAEEGWNKILEAIKELIEEIRGPLTQSIDNLPKEKRIRIRYEEDGDPSGEEDRRGGGGGGGPLSTGRATGVLSTSLAAMMPTLPAVSRFDPTLDLAGIRSAVPQAVTTNSANFMLLPMSIGGGTDSFQMAREVMRHMEGTLGTNSTGLETKLELLFDDYLRTYGGRPRG